MANGFNTPVKSALGVGLHEVWICDRALARPLTRVGWSSLDYGRELSQVSEASITVPMATCSALVGASLGGRVQTWTHGLIVYRDGREQWRGPIVDIDRAPGDDAIKIVARDKMQWTDRRFPEIDIDMEFADLSSAFDVLIKQATRRDNRFRLTSSSRPAGVAGRRSYSSTSGGSVLSLIGELTRTALDWTMVDDVLHSGGQLWRNFVPLRANQESFVGRIGVREDGLSKTNSAKVAGANTGGSKGFSVIGAYEDWSPASGLLQSFTSEADVLDEASAVAAARERVTGSGGKATAISLPALSPSFAAALENVCPGGRIELAVPDPVFEISGTYTIVSVKVAVDRNESGQTESISITVEDI